MKGIYYIRHIVSRKVYIGSSNNIKKRIQHHISELRKNKHKNNYLQNAYNKYGEESFEFGIVELCEDLIKNEQYWLNILPNLYNINPRADRLIRTPEIIEAHRVEMKKWWEENREDMMGRTPWNKGKKLSRKHVEKLRNAKRVFTEKGKQKKRNKIRERLPEVSAYLNGTYIDTFRSAPDCAEDPRIDTTYDAIRKCLRRDIKHRKGYTFHYGRPSK